MIKISFVSHAAEFEDPTTDFLPDYVNSYGVLPPLLPHSLHRSIVFNFRLGPELEGSDFECLKRTGCGFDDETSVLTMSFSRE